jgi:hypothetical protein
MINIFLFLYLKEKTFYFRFDLYIVDHVSMKFNVLSIPFFVSDELNFLLHKYIYIYYNGTED